MSSSGEAFDHLQEIKNIFSKLNHDLKKHKCLSNFLPSASLQNIAFENKNIKHRFISSLSYLLFLEQLAKEQFSEVDENALQKTNETIAECNKKKQTLKSFLEEKDQLFEEMMSVDKVENLSLNLEATFKETQATKRDYSDLAKKVEAVSTALNENCTSRADLQKLLREEEATIQNCMNRLNPYFCSSKVPLIPVGFASFLDGRVDDEVALEDSQPVCRETLSGVKMVSTHPTHDILEVFYVNTCMRKSSVEVKVTYGNACKSIESIAIRNSPVNVEDLVASAIKANDLGSVLPLLQNRLSES